MKNIARLAVFFSISFILLFLFAVLYRFLALWIETARVLPEGHEYSGAVITAMAWAVPFTLYVSVLLALSYSVRQKMPACLSICTIIVLSAAFTLGSSLGIRRAGAVNFALELAPAIREKPGLILSRSDTAVVLLGADGVDGPRVVSFPDQDLLYQGELLWPGGAALTPALPFGGETPWFVGSIVIDFTLCARQLDARLSKGLLSFAVYAGALILLLASLRFFMGLSAWPMANLFLGAVIFRGILALEIFLNTRETQFLISSFLGKRFAGELVTPLVLSGLGLFILIYTLLANLARGKAAKDD